MDKNRKSNGAVVVLDVGKTLAKATLWSSSRELLSRRTRPNERIIEDGFPVLDYRGIEEWFCQALANFGGMAEIIGIIPVAHGAAFCIVDRDELVMAPLDYEAVPPNEIHHDYLALRDEFDVTGSPCLPMGLNLGMQLFWLQRVRSEKFARGTILTWPQYWAWRLSGSKAIEVTSLGCHTDLWIPIENRPSPMAVSLGWADRFAPTHKASDVVGMVRDEWCRRAALSNDCEVFCGLHDSNAALLAARLHPTIGNRECTVLSTGTWFVAMRSLCRDALYPKLQEDCDCLLNVDVWGNPVPSSRFMGGREAELLEAGNGTYIDVTANCDELLRLAAEMVTTGVFALPTFEAGVGPFPHAIGTWVRRPSNCMARRAVAGLYLALMANRSLDLVGTCGPIVIEGRFASDSVFTRTLATLRPNDSVYLSSAQDSLALGALALFDGHIPRPYEMTMVKPLDFDIATYATGWREMVANAARSTSKATPIIREKSK